MTRNAVYSIARIDPDAVWIVDESAAYPMALTVTNDADRVVAEVAKNHGAEKRIFCRDTSDQWDELRHDHGAFTGFKFGTEGREAPC